MAQTAESKPEPAAGTLERMTARWSDPHRLPGPPAGYRDGNALATTFARLDAEEEEAKSNADGAPTAAQALAWLQDLPALWASADASGRRLLAEAVFERIDVLGIACAEITPTPEAESRGRSDASGEPVVLSAKVKTGRGERDSPFVTHVPPRPSFTMVNRTPAPRLRLAAARSA